MANLFLYVTEFKDLIELHQSGVMPQLPPTASQNLAVGAEVKSAVFNVATRFLRLQAGAACSVAFGTAPTATTADMRIPIDQRGEYFAVPRGSSWKMSVIANP